MARHCLRFLLLCAILGLGCKRAPPEPEHDPDAGAAVEKPSDLHWKIPPTWNVEKTAEHGTYRAKYKIAASGDAKYEAEVLIQRLGSGPKADTAPKLQEFLGSFEGKGSESPKREHFRVHDFDVDMVEVAATYRFPMTPPMGPGKKPVATVLKEDWRGIAAGVKAGERGNWLFHIVGPTDSVAAARSDFRNMLESLE